MGRRGKAMSLTRTCIGWMRLSYCVDIEDIVVIMNSCTEGDAERMKKKRDKKRAYDEKEQILLQILYGIY